jgi:L-malate glycosyltransferase
MAANILHCHSTFDLGGKEARAVRLMNAFGDKARHTVLSGVPGALGAKTSLDPAISVRFPEVYPPLTGAPAMHRFKALAEYMRDYDLVLTYNWGAMDAVMARRLYARYLPPLIHHEDGFNADEALRLRRDRNLYRRIALSASQALVVPSERLELIAKSVWKQRQPRLHRIANGIDVAAYSQGPRVPIAGLNKAPSDLVIGTLAGLRTVKNLPRLVRAAATVPGVKLVIVGEGPERETIMAEAGRCGMASRLLMPGFMAQPQEFIGHFDIFALSSDSEQFPISLVEAMAAGLPVAAMDVGDVRTMVSTENQPFIAANEQELAENIRLLASDFALRQRVGAANRRRAVTDFDEHRMIDAYAALYSDAMKRPNSLRKS